VLTLRPQNDGDDSSGWHVKSVRMEPYVVHPSALVRVGTGTQIPNKIHSLTIACLSRMPPDCMRYVASSSDESYHASTCWAACRGMWSRQRRATRWVSSASGRHKVAPSALWGNVWLGVPARALS
jgi:hypothetical protein